MRLLGNILWLLLGGILMGLLWLAIGCIWCITIVGIPMGLQCFRYAAFPFGATFHDCSDIRTVPTVIYY